MKGLCNATGTSMMVPKPASATQLELQHDWRVIAGAEKQNFWLVRDDENPAIIFAMSALMIRRSLRSPGQVRIRSRTRCSLPSGCSRRGLWQHTHKTLATDSDDVVLWTPAVSSACGFHESLCRRILAGERLWPRTHEREPS